MGATSTTTGQPVPPVAVTTPSRRRRRLDSEDRELLALVKAVLEDRAMDAPLRRRLHDDIRIRLRATPKDVYGAAVSCVRRSTGGRRYEPSQTEHEPHVAKMLDSMLVDPNLRTETRMRLYREIPELVRSARG